MMSGTAGGVGPHVAALGGCFNSFPNGCLNLVPKTIDRAISTGDIFN